MKVSDERYIRRSIWLDRLADFIVFTVLTIALAILMLGCGSGKELKSLAAAQDVHYAVKKAWIAHVKSEYARIDTLPLSEREGARQKLGERRKTALALSQHFDAVWDSAWARARYNKESPATAEVWAALNEFERSVGQ